MSKTTLSQGKLPPTVLRKMLRSFRGKLVVPPEIGIDVGVSLARGKYLVSSSDPITGTRKRIGWHAVNVSANDVATSGIMPDVLNVIALFPEGTREADIHRIIAEMNRTARDLNIAVAGGHTEITPGLKRPIITVTAMGSGKKFVTAAGSKPFDSILVTKTAGIEGTSILAGLPSVKKLVGQSWARKGRALIDELSVMKEAREAFQTGQVHAMHDVTEGGVVGAVYEMSVASKVGFQINEECVPVDESTGAICKVLSADPLKLIGSGSLLIACLEKSSQLIAGRLESKGILCSQIGRFLPLKQGRFLEREGKRIRVTEDSIRDELWRLLSKYGDLS